MKSFYFFILLSLFFVSCSENEDVVVNDSFLQTEFSAQYAHRGGTSLSPEDFDEAKGLYIAMINSSEYEIYTASLRTFVVKLNDNEADFETKDDAMKWINQNISVTSFTNVSEFESMFDDNINALEVLVDLNERVYELMSGADLGQLQVILSPGNSKIDYPVVTDSCQEECERICDEAMIANENARDQGIRELYYVRGLAYLIALNSVNTKYDEEWVKISKAYTTCAGKC